MKRALPAFVESKKYRTIQFCPHYKNLNTVRVCDSYPLLLAYDCTDYSENFQLFSTLNKKNSYCQIDVKQSGKAKTALTSHHGPYHSLRMPLSWKVGLANFIVSWKLYCPLSDERFHTYTSTEQQPFDERCAKRSKKYHFSEVFNRRRRNFKVRWTGLLHDPDRLHYSPDPPRSTWSRQSHSRLQTRSQQTRNTNIMVVVY